MFPIQILASLSRSSEWSFRHDIYSKYTHIPVDFLFDHKNRVFVGENEFHAVSIPTQCKQTPCDTVWIWRDLQVILPFERLAAHTAHVFPFVAVRQFVFGERGRVPEHLSTHLQHKHTHKPPVSLIFHVAIWIHLSMHIFSVQRQFFVQHFRHTKNTETGCLFIISFIFTTLTNCNNVHIILNLCIHFEATS